MMNALDYYYLVLLQGFGRRLDYGATGVMALTFTINLFSLVILSNHYILDSH